MSNLIRFETTKHTFNSAQRGHGIEIASAQQITPDYYVPKIPGAVLTTELGSFWVATRYANVGKVHFGSARMSSPLKYCIDTRGVPILERPKDGGNVHVFHATRDEVVRLITSLQEAQNLTDNSVTEGAITGLQNGLISFLASGMILIPCGLLGGPFGVAAGTKLASVVGISVGLGTGAAQWKSLKDAHNVERQVHGLLKAWLNYLDGRQDSECMKQFMEVVQTNQVFENAGEGSLPRIIWDSLKQQLDEMIQVEEEADTSFFEYAAFRSGALSQIASGRLLAGPEQTSVQP